MLSPSEELLRIKRSERYVYSIINSADLTDDEKKKLLEEEYDRCIEEYKKSNVSLTTIIILVIAFFASLCIFG